MEFRIGFSSVKHFIPKVPSCIELRFEIDFWQLKRKGLSIGILMIMSESSDRTWSKDVVRLVCMSDTHNKEYTRTGIPHGDVLIHAGDLTKIGTKKELIAARAYIDSFPHPQKIVIAGNHEISLDTPFYCGPTNRFHRDLFKSKKLDRTKYSSQCRDIISQTSGSSSSIYNYLEDSSCFIDSGACVQGSVASPQIRVYGSPYQPEQYLMGFTLPTGPLLEAKWAQISDDVDVLVTHGPPKGILDGLFDGTHVGCEHLLEAVQSRVKPRVHIFGHIHEGYGT